MQARGSAPYRVWIEDGILFSEYAHTFTAEYALEAEKKSIELLDKQNIRTIPAILDLSKVNGASFKLSLHEVGKLLGSMDLAKRLSAVWIVGATGIVEKTINIINDTFMGGRIHLTGTVEEAKAGIKANLDSEPFLQQNP